MGAALEKLAADKRIVLHCKTGVRSAEALAVVQGARGSRTRCTSAAACSAWVNQIEPEKPSY